MSEHQTELLAAWLHGELDPGQRERVTVHVDGCPDCAEELAALRGSHRRLEELVPLSAPDRVWERVEADLREAAVPSVGWRPGSWVVAASLAAVLLLALLPLPPGSPEVPLDAWFTRLEARASRSDALATPVDGFRPAAAEDAYRAAGMLDAARHSPAPEYGFWRGGTYRFEGGEVAQLVYHGADTAFGVFVAPHGARLDFGDRATTRVRMGDWECTQVASRDLAVYWSVSGDRQSVLVADADADLDVASILRFFVYGGWERES